MESVKKSQEKNLQINHSLETKRVWIEKYGNKAYVEYELNGDILDIKHTVVPTPLEGQGIASNLVQYVYNYAMQQGLRPYATCSYAQLWFKKNIN